MKTERLQAFSDGIFAILITILVLELKLPDYQPGKLAQGVWQQWPTLVAYLLTFIYIGILWLFHHDMFQHVQKTTVALNVLNLLSIFLTTLLSYAMTLLSETLVSWEVADLRFAVAVYAGLAALISLSYERFFAYLSRQPQLLTTPALAAGFRDSRRYPLISLGLYGGALLFSWLFLPMAALLLVLGILYHGYAYWRVARQG